MPRDGARSVSSTLADRALQPVLRQVVPRFDRLALRRYRTLAKRGGEGRDPAVVEHETIDAFRRLVDRADGPRVAGYDSLVVRAFRGLAERDRTGQEHLKLVRTALLDDFHRLYYRNRKRTWQQTYFLGTKILKNPLDLWLYQEILHEVRPDIIVEAGTKHGGSAFYLASLCDLLDNGRVVTIDTVPEPNRPEHHRITYLTGSSTDADIVAQVDEMIGGGRALVILDSDHRCKHVLDELRTWHTRVPVGSYIIVEDSNINGHPVSIDWGPGPMEAIDTFLAENDDYVVDESKHKFFFTFNPRGYLKRVS